jgi:nicotinamidase-related amidase
MLNTDDSCLILIDVQGKLAQIQLHQEALFRNLRLLVQGMQLFNIPIIWTEHVPEKLGPTIPQLKELLVDQEPIVKCEFSCGQNTVFITELDRLRVSTVLVAGIETHVCIYQTAVDLLQKNYHVEVVADAVSSRRAYDKEIGLEKIRLAGASLTTVELVLFELQRVAEGERFRQLIHLIKQA